MAGVIVTYAYKGWLRAVKRELTQSEGLLNRFTLFDGKRWTALMAAACRGENWEIVKYLLEEGADFKLTDNNGNNALHIACRYNNSNSKNIRLLSDAMKDTDSINQKKQRR